MIFPNPSPNALNKRGLRQFAIILIICIVICLLFILHFYYKSAFGAFSDYDVQKHPEKYPEFDFAAVHLRPELYENSAGMISGTFIEYVSLAPNAESPYTYFLVAQDGLAENPNALWLVYGLLTDDQRHGLAPGIDVVLYGTCAGKILLKTLVSERDYPALHFQNINP